MEERYLTISQVAEMLQVTKPTVHKLMRQRSGGLSYIKIGRSTRFAASEVNSFLQQHTYND